MAQKIGDAWSSIRRVIREGLSFAQIKDLVGESGLPVHNLSHLQQKYSGGASKGQLMDGIDGLYNYLDEDSRNRFVVACVEGILKKDNTLLEELQTTLGRVGWGVSLDGVYPLRLQIELETFKLDDRINEGIQKTLHRYRDGDFDGAVTAICGLVDSITEKVYDAKILGNHRDASYQERVAKSFRALESEFKRSLSNIDEDSRDKMWNNHCGSVNQAAFVLGMFRRKYSDVHGVQDAAPQLVQRAIDCAVFIVRSISGLT